MAYSSDDLALLTGVGKALANWSGIELQMCSLFVHIADNPDPDKSRALFDCIISFEVRLAILDRLMPMEGTNETEGEMWSRMSAKLTKLYKKRHELAHFALHSDGKKSCVSPFLTLDAWTRGAHRKLDLGQVEDRSAKFVEAFNAMAWFIARAKERRDMIGEDRALLVSEPPLVPLLRELANQILAGRKLPSEPSSP